MIYERISEEKVFRLKSVCLERSLDSSPALLGFMGLEFTAFSSSISISIHKERSQEEFFLLSKNYTFFSFFHSSSYAILPASKGFISVHMKGESVWCCYCLCSALLATFLHSSLYDQLELVKRDLWLSYPTLTLSWSWRGRLKAGKWKDSDFQSLSIKNWLPSGW